MLLRQCYTVAMSVDLLNAIGVIGILIAVVISSAVCYFSVIKANKKYHSGQPIMPGSKPNWLETQLLGKDCVHLHFLLSNGFYEQKWLEREIYDLRENNWYSDLHYGSLPYVAPLLALAINDRWDEVDGLLADHLAAVGADEATDRDYRQDGIHNSQMEQLTAATHRQLIQVQAAAATRDVEELKKSLNITAHDNNASRRARTIAVSFIVIPVSIVLVLTLAVFYFLDVFILP